MNRVKHITATSVGITSEEDAVRKFNASLRAAVSEESKFYWDTVSNVHSSIISGTMSVRKKKNVEENGARY